ncbi:MAG: FmdB family zinc ribbon protein [Promethearchaeota archaeon]|jgi:putative FmdB family regulatory protein
MLRMFDWQCEHCGHEFESMQKMDMAIITCVKCNHDVCYKIFPKSAPSINLTYNPKKDICDWDGNTSQYYRLYNEAKARGEKVELPE